jgi:[NiFe] hydrogenase large subunit/hydrogenase large subunit
MARIVIDPITRIEGHLRIEAAVDQGAVQEAWVAATMFRGIEPILRGRDPREAWIFTQRICGVCTTVHAIASIRAVERALAIEPPTNARLLRNLVMAAQTVQDHVVHFYHLHALDWVDVVSALGADPVATARLAQSTSDWALSSADYFSGVQNKLRALTARNQLGPFAHAYWGHSAYRLPPEANLLAVAHYVEALQWQRKLAQMHALLGGKNPHLQGFLVGGMATPTALNQQAALNMNSLAQMRTLVAEAQEFVNSVYLPDLMTIASYYPEWAELGGGRSNLLACGDFPETDGHDGRLYFPGGVVWHGDLSRLEPFDESKVTEEVARSWYRYNGGDEVALSPAEGETTPNYTGPRPPYEQLDVDQKYSWCKAPRYDGQPMEVGPLARMVVAYGQGHEEVRRAVDGVLARLSLRPEHLFSTLGRTAARAIETQLLAQRMEHWLAELTERMGRGEQRVHHGDSWDPSSWPKECMGAGFHEAPRGILGHWIRIEDQSIANYQCVVPTTWSASPRDGNGQSGPLEQALQATPMANEGQPLEILRTVHSFDPCVACAVHVLDLSGQPLSVVRTS